MAELRIETINLDVVADIVDPPRPRDHSITHVTELIGLAAKVSGQKTYDDGPPDERSRGIMAFGRIWEWLIRYYMDTRYQEWGYTSIDYDVRLTRDDITGSLDGLMVGPSESAIYSKEPLISEMKARFSRPADPRDHWRYITQIKTYCKMARTTKTVMPALHMNTRPPEAIFNLYWLDFSQQEIDENWQMMMNMKRYKAERGG